MWRFLTLSLVLVVPVSVVETLYHSGHGGHYGRHQTCALILNGPGKSSAFDYTRRVLYGAHGGYDGPNTCITFDAVNYALAEALRYHRVERPEQEWRAEQLAPVGELFLEVSRIIAKKYGLSAWDIENQLPLLDTYHTDLIQFCPDFLGPLHCVPGKYRRFDGLCNNLEHPTWGARLTTFTRLLPPAYGDGFSEPRPGYGGYDLPSARVVSSAVHFEEGYNEHSATTLIISWGQFMDHDFTLTGTQLNPLDRNEFEGCCHPTLGQKSPYCLEIAIPPNDPFFSRHGVTCQDFVRGFPGVRHGCRLGSRAQFNLLTSTIDANTVYGVRESFARSLRSGYGGRLRMNPVLNPYGLKDLLPPKTDIPAEGCTRGPHEQHLFCFDGGEIRVSEQLILTCMHTLWAREHNRIAGELAAINPHWDDEILYQEARHIVVAMIQHITFNEFLPVLLGKDVLKKFGLLLQKEGYWNGYDPSLNPGILASFASAAFRFGHSLLPTNIERWNKGHRFVTSRPLSDLIRRPFDLYEPGVIDEYYLGMTNQPALAMDDFVTFQVTTMLFKKPGAEHGVDLASFNLQRNREFGLPGYVQYRKFCGLPPVETWDDLLGTMSNETVRRYASVLRTPHDIDLWSGGVAERALPGSILGPTFSCIIATQFSNVRRGDRFWYEIGGQPSSFTPDQLEEIRKARAARVLCDNTDLIETIQLYPMVLPDHEINPRVSCKSSIIPSIDLTKWLEYPGNYGAHSKTPTLVQPAPYGYTPSLSAPDRNGKAINEHAIYLLRAALHSGQYAGEFDSPHRKPLVPYPGKVRPLPTKRPVYLSQEYIDHLDDQLKRSGFPSLSGLYNILASPQNALYKRASNATEFFGMYEPYSPRKVSSYRHEMDEVYETAVHGPMNFSEHISARSFVPIRTSHGNFTLQDLVALGEHLLQLRQEETFVDFNDVGTAKTSVSSSSDGDSQNAGNSIKPKPSKSRKVPRSSKTRPRKRTVPDKPETSQTKDETPVTEDAKSFEQSRAETHALLQKDIEAAMEAIKALEDSYRVLQEEIDRARKLFPATDPIQKNLDELLSSAPLPASLDIKAAHHQQSRENSTNRTV